MVVGRAVEGVVGIDHIFESGLKELKGAGLVLGDFLGFIVSRICKVFWEKRRVFEKYLANCNTLFESRNPGFRE